MLRTFIFIAALQALASSQSAQVAPSRSPASIEGVVIDAVSGDPISQAVINVYDSPRTIPRPAVPVMTAANGRFLIEGLSVERVFVGAVKLGYALTELKFSLAPGEQLQNVVVRLQPSALTTGVISGRVLESDGRPAVEVQVGPQKQGDGPDPALVIRTNDRGEFRALDIPPGRYLVSYSKRPADPQTGRPQAAPRNAGSFEPPVPGSMGVLYPGVTEVARASMVDVKAGEETRLQDVVLNPLLRLGLVRFRIINATGQPAGSTIDFGIARTTGNVGATPGGPPGFDGTFIDAAGNWTAEIKVVDRNGVPVNNAVVALRAEPQESRSAIPLIYRSDSTDQNGAFALRRIVPGTYRLYALAAAGPTAFLGDEFIRQLGDRGQLIEIKPGDRLEVMVTASDQ